MSRPRRPARSVLDNRFIVVTALLTAAGASAYTSNPLPILLTLAPLAFHAWELASYAADRVDAPSDQRRPG